MLPLRMTKVAFGVGRGNSQKRRGVCCCDDGIRKLTRAKDEVEFLRRLTQTHSSRDTNSCQALLYLAPGVDCLEFFFSFLLTLKLRTIKSTGLDVLSLGVGHIQCKSDRFLFCCHIASRANLIVSPIRQKLRYINSKRYQRALTTAAATYHLYIDTILNETARSRRATCS